MSLGRSRHKVGRGYFGPLPATIWPIIRKAWEEGIAVSSNLSREASTEIALAASLGWITTVTADGMGYSRIWNVTEQGLTALHESKHYDQENAPANASSH